MRDLCYIFVRYDGDWQYSIQLPYIRHVHNSFDDLLVEATEALGGEPEFWERMIPEILPAAISGSSASGGGHDMILDSGLAAACMGMI